MSVTAVLAVAACIGNAPPPNDAGADGSAPESDGGDGAAQDAAIVNGCTTFTDDRGVSSPTIGLPPAPPAAQYNPNCVHIKAGQSIIFSGDFTDFPLEPFGGASGNPITPVGSGNIATFGFPSAGIFGFDCPTSPAVMFGAVEVTTN